MCNKTIIIRFGFGDIWNNQDRDKNYSWSVDNLDLDYFGIQYTMHEQSLSQRFDWLVLIGPCNDL